MKHFLDVMSWVRRIPVLPQDTDNIDGYRYYLKEVFEHNAASAYALYLAVSVSNAHGDVRDMLRAIYEFEATYGNKLHGRMTLDDLKQLVSQYMTDRGN